MWTSPLYCMISRITIHQALKMSQNMYFTNYCRVLEMTQYPLHYVRFIKLLSFIKQTYKVVCKYPSFNHPKKNQQKNHTNHGKIEFSLFEIEIVNFIKSNRPVIYVTKSLLLRIFYLHNAWCDTFACKIITIDCCWSVNQYFSYMHENNFTKEQLYSLTHVCVVY